MFEKKFITFTWTLFLFRDIRAVAGTDSFVAWLDVLIKYLSVVFVARFYVDDCTDA